MRGVVVLIAMAIEGCRQESPLSREERARRVMTDLLFQSGAVSEEEMEIRCKELIAVLGQKEAKLLGIALFENNVGRLGISPETWANASEQDKKDARDYVGSKVNQVYHVCKHSFG